MKKKFWTGEKLLSISAVLVSLLTLSVYLYQTNLIKKQQYMSVYPYLNMSNNFSGSLQYKFVLKNVGIGPALIDSILIIGPDGKKYNDLIDYVDDVVPSEDSIWYLHSNISAGRLIPVNEEIALIQLVNDDLLEQLGASGYDDLPKNDIADSGRLYEILNDDNLHIKIVYQSIYGETWVINNQDLVPVKRE